MDYDDLNDIHDYLDHKSIHIFLKEKQKLGVIPSNFNLLFIYA